MPWCFIKEEKKERYMPCFDVILDKKYQNSKLGSPTWLTVYKDNIIYFILEPTIGFGEQINVIRALTSVIFKLFYFITSKLTLSIIPYYFITHPTS